jgi:hypothetical protein
MRHNVCQIRGNKEGFPSSAAPYECLTYAEWRQYAMYR